MPSRVTEEKGRRTDTMRRRLSFDAAAVAVCLNPASRPAVPSMSAELELTFRPDTHLTEVMRLRVQSLQQRGHKGQDGERLLGPNEAVYRLDFPGGELSFSRWSAGPVRTGRLSIAATSQLWTPDLTNLMTRQLLEPVGVFWRAAGDSSAAAVRCYEADVHELGERIAESARVRKVMYFLFAFADGCGPQDVDCSITFKVDR